PGAATLGDAVDAGSALASALISPRQDFALGLSADNQTARIIQLRTPGAPPLTLDNLSAPDRMLLSPSGSAALFYWQEPSRIAVLTGLPDALAIRELSAGGLGALSALAVADDGYIAAAAGSGSGWFATPDGNFVPLSVPDATVALSFGPNTHDL